MREILFRGKRGTKWFYGWYCGKTLTPDMSDTEECRQIIDFNTLYCHVVDPETVGQFTGLTDKNCKKIFEGDIVLFDYIGANRGVNGKAAVIFSNGKFGVLWGWHKEFVPLDGFANTTLEVIGNIHDNPELLNK